MLAWRERHDRLMSSQHSLSPRAIRRLILEQSKRANVGHIGSALSVADIVAVQGLG